MALRSGDVALVTALLTTTICYLLYHYGSLAIARRLDGDDGPLSAKSAFCGRALGVVALGCIPLLLALVPLAATLNDIGLGIGKPVRIVWVGGLLSGLLLGVAYAASRGNGHTDHYPQIRQLQWTRATLRWNVATWLAYLVAYEFLFRGFLLSYLVDGIGLWSGLTVMTGLYVFAHLPKNASETAGCIVMGYVFGLAVLYCEAIWPAVLSHAVVATSNDYFAFRRHPKMRIVE